MELGEKLRKARMEAGLSQRELCADIVSRNMLSQIEHGSANPSMKTLQHLAARLGKSVSYFLEEDTAVSPNQAVMTSVRQLYDAGDWAGAVLALAEYQSPDAIFDREKQLLWVLLHLHLAEQAIAQGREPYARELLEKAAPEPAYCAEALTRQRLLLLGRIRGHAVCGQLPSLDGELLLRAEEALDAGKPERAAHLLEAAEDHTSPGWNMLRGKAHIAAGNFREAARCFHRAETAFPKESAICLELCYRKLEDYKRAYEYACKQK